MYNRTSKNILTHKEFAKRVLKYSLFSLFLIASSLGIGIIGYHYIGKLTWIDSIYNAAMILTGMGPVNVMSSNAAKLFASSYALFSGVVFLSTVAVFFAPFAHRLMHLLHIEEIDEQD
ncbi:hypothetical protein SAMN06298216_1089 [Spirosomataceae bacterium TFI 002]|nr:hypothetical protein SAMN06298216_1089 [Spirosomataceae bacterium TFI 002]